jgi:hypothetical protein
MKEEGSKGKEKGKKAEAVQLLDAKTANNTAITISRFKKTPEQIATYPTA